MDDAIVVQGLSKQFRRYHHDRPWTLQEAFLRGLRRMRPVERFSALCDVSFSVAPGRMLGVVGQNGAGKSTLLRLIGGIGRPDAGRVKIRGRIGALLDLGAGFHPDLTGRENVLIGGVINGLTLREVTERFDAIVAFSELREFIDNPLRTYSSGMWMRLAFAVAVHVEPEILLIDEVLAVGDLAFQRKCIERITQFKAKGCTIVLVSHDVGLIRGFCDEALWLREGRLVAHGAADEVVSQYVTEVDAGAPRLAADYARL
jgi:lipopolysaccharide transport system ATP-binding protein